MSAQVQSGDDVKIHYTGTLQDGTVFDSSRERGQPLAFKAGAGQMIQGFDEGVMGMAVGEKKTLNIPADKAYGQKQDHLLVTFTKDKFPQDAPIAVGQEFTLQTQDGRPVPVRIIEIKEDEVILDANHPLAGKDLVFDVELLEVTSHGTELFD